VAPEGLEDGLKTALQTGLEDGLKAVSVTAVIDLISLDLYLRRENEFAFGMDMAHEESNVSQDIWNPVPLVQGSTRWYVLVRTSTSSSQYMAVREKAKLYIPVQTSLYWSMTCLYQYILVCTGMYRTVKGGKEVQPSTKRYTVVQGTVQGGTRQYVLVCTGMY
jgi:hypothetical protein